MLADTDAVDEHAWIAARVETVGQAAAREVPLLTHYRATRSGQRRRYRAGSTRRARIAVVRQPYYSVPARLSGHRVQGRVGR